MLRMATVESRDGLEFDWSDVKNYADIIDNGNGGG